MKVSHLAVLAFAIQAPVMAQNAEQMLFCTSQFGDPMNHEAKDKCTGQTWYYYNADLKPAATIITKTNVNGPEQILQNFTLYEYNQAGNVTAARNYEFRLSGVDERTLQESANTVTYTYNELDQLVEEVQGSNVIRYQYDAQGNRIKETKYTQQNNSSTLKEGKSIVYSDFVNGLPSMAVSTHADTKLTGEFYDEIYTYDAQGHKTVSLRLNSTSKAFKQEEHWTYDGDMLVRYELFNKRDSQGNLTPKTETTYTPQDGNIVLRQTRSYDNILKKWTTAAIYYQDAYMDLSEKAAVTDFKLVSINCDPSASNTLHVEFTVPTLALQNSNTQFRIFCNGEAIATIPMADVSNADCPLQRAKNGNLVFTHSDLANGTYNYFIQTVGEDGTGYCASNAMSQTVTLVLPAAYNLYVSAWKKDDNGDNVATLHFSAPKASASLGFISNSVMVGNLKVAEVVFDVNEDTTTEITIPNESESEYVYILTRYQYGEAMSEKLLVVPGIVNQAPADELQYDLDDNGSVNLDDVEWLGNYLLDLDSSATPDMKYDLNQDGSVNVSDVVWLARQLLSSL